MVPLNTIKPMKRTPFNRAFALLYSIAILALLYRHALTLLSSASFSSFLLSVTMLTADLLAALLWLTAQAFRMRPVVRQEYPENLSKVVAEGKDFPALDVFICTADPYREPPIGVVNTALSVMAYDYPAEKLSVYVSDDGGSELTLFALMEAAKFGRSWLPFCRDNMITKRCPEAYFKANYPSNSETQNIKILYESMKERVTKVVDLGKVSDEYANCNQEREIFSKWNEGFTSQDHPAVIQVLLESAKDNDLTGHSMPNLVYVSREKRKLIPHHFKAGALNTLIRVSATMTNAPLILNLDCDMHSNDPATPLRVLCYFLDQSIRPNLSYVQLPQSFRGLNKADTNGCEFKRLFYINAAGMDGLLGPDNFGTGCFFQRRAFFGGPGPSSFLQPELQELSPDYKVKNPITTPPTLELAQKAASSKYEHQTNWGSKVGFRYGSLVEDYYTGYLLHCEGWRAIYCNPGNPAFLGDAPISFSDVVNQTKRWAIGLLEVVISKYSPLTYGTKALGLIMSSCYSNYALWPISCFPILIYSVVPQLALLNRVFIFPKVTDNWIYLYTFLFIGAYGQDCLEFILSQSTWGRWWSDQRMYLLRGFTSCLFGTLEYIITKQLGIGTLGFHVTSKAIDDEAKRRYEEGMFDFGDSSAMFVPLTTAAIVNFAALIGGFLHVLRGGDLAEMFGQMFIAGFAAVNCLPIYEAMVLRTDKGKMSTRISLVSTVLALALYGLVSFISAY